MEKKHSRKEESKKRDMVAYRKSCNPRGTGLSHFILMDKEKK